MAPLHGLHAISHEKFAETQRNAAVPFLRIPPELRLVIYEYFAYEKEAINVKQLAPRSNKFLWVTDDTGSYGSNLKRRRIFISDLLRVSRQIHIELTKSPVFDRVNKFEFRNPRRLLDFLAALTPERRGFLRHIVVSFEEFQTAILIPGLDDYPQPLASAATEALHHVATLLSQCSSLRHLGLRLALWDRSSLDSVLLKFIQHIRTNDLRLTLWASPCLEPVPVSPSHKYKVDLTVARVSCSEDSTIPEFGPRTMSLITEAQVALMSFTQELKDDRNTGKDPRDNHNDSQVAEALSFAQIDFPGESRIEQDRFTDMGGSISSRTRQKCRKELVDRYGVIQRERCKYNAEGELTCTNIIIRDLRWSGSAIEADVEFTWPPGDFERTRSWEPIEAAMCESQHYSVWRYFDKLLKQRLTYSSLADYQQIIRERPSPEDVMAMVPGILVDIGTGQSIRELNFIKSWRDLWQSTINEYKEMACLIQEESAKKMKDNGKGHYNRLSKRVKRS